MDKVFIGIGLFFGLLALGSNLDTEKWTDRLNYIAVGALTIAFVILISR